MSLEVRREGWGRDMDQGVLSIHKVVEILGGKELTCGVCTEETKREAQVSALQNTGT